MIDFVINENFSLVAERGGGGGVILLPCSYKFLLMFFIRLCSYSIQSFILSKLVLLVSYELSLSQMLLGGVILVFL